MGIMVYSSLWVMQDLYRQPYFLASESVFGRVGLLRLEILSFGFGDFWLRGCGFRVGLQGLEENRGSSYLKSRCLGYRRDG